MVISDFECPTIKETVNGSIPDREQEILDLHTQQHLGESSLISLLSPPGLVVSRTLTCCCCQKEFTVNLAVRKEDEIT